MDYGYVRVSSRDQNEDRQIMKLKSIGIDESRIYVDKQSGENFERPQYNNLLQIINKGDCIFTLSIDRLGRNYDDIRRQWMHIVKELHVDIVVIDMPILDTRAAKDLMGTFLSDIVLQILSFVAENERNNIRMRQADGIKAARERGVQFGRPRINLPNNFPMYAKKYMDGEISGRDAAAILNMSASRFYRRANEWKHFLQNSSNYHKKDL